MRRNIFGKILLSVMAVALLFALFAVPGKRAAAYWDDDDDDEDYSYLNWKIGEEITNLWLEKTEIEADENGEIYVVFHFDLKSLPSTIRDTKKYGIFFTSGFPTDLYGYYLQPSFVFSQDELELKDNAMGCRFSVKDDLTGLTMGIVEMNSNNNPAELPDSNARISFTITHPYLPEKPVEIPYVFLDEVKNFKTSQEIYTSDTAGECKVEFSFDVKNLPEKDEDKNKEYNIYIAVEPEKQSDYTDYPHVSFKLGNLKKEGNKFTLKFNRNGDSLSAQFMSIFGDVGDDELLFTAGIEKSAYGYGPDAMPTITTNFKVQRTATKDWTISSMISDVKTDKEEYSMGSLQLVKVKFNNKMVPTDDAYSLGDVYIMVISDEGYVIEYKKLSPWDLKLGENEITLSCRFPSKGIYHLAICDYYHIADENDPDDFPEINCILGPYEFVVTKAKSSDGTLVDTKDYVSPQYLFYSKDQGNSLKVYYSVSDSSSDYRLYVIKGHTVSYSADTSGKMLENSDFMSRLKEMPIELGKTNTLDIKTKFNGFGLYTVVLFNVTTKQLAAEESFYVVPEEYLIQRDTSKTSDTGKVPFSCDAEIWNMDLGKDQTLSFNVEFPLDYKEYVEEFQLKYGKGSKYHDYYDPSKYTNPNNVEYEDDDDDYEPDEFEEAFFKDDYSAYMTVKYVPAGSKESRVLYRKELKGMYKTHKIEISSKELLNKIYETSGNDISYAGVVTVEFSNESGKLGFETLYNEALVSFTESFSFSVNKEAGIKSAKADAKKTERAYGENASFTVTDTLGGKIYADIYKGKKKVATVEGKCSLNQDGTATGKVSWDLKNSKGEYSAKGSYKAKIYTVNEYVEYAKDGTKDTKKVKSAVKSVSFKLVKPSRKLTLSASAAGSSGENYVYLENPVIGITAATNIGSKITIKIKNSSGKEIQSGVYVNGKGTGVFSMNLSGGSLKAGSYKAEVKAETLDGASKTATCSFEVKKMPKPAIKDISVSTSTDTGAGSLSFSVTQPSKVKVVIKSGSTVKQTVINQNYSAGTIKTSFSIGGYAAGNYTVEITAENSGGTATASKAFEVKKKPVVVKKPAASSLNIKYLSGGKKGDQYQCSFNYVGKNAKVVIDVMWNDCEEIVYTYEGTTKSDTGTFTFTWDGYKSNGFRAWAGSYTMRVYLVNSAGSTEYLRRDFTIGEG